MALDGTATEDGRYLVITIARERRRERVLVRDLAEPYAMPVELIDNFDHESRCRQRRAVCSQDGRRCAAATADGHRPPQAHRPDWKEIIPQVEATLTQVSLVGDRFIACYLKDVGQSGKGVRRDGRFVRDIALPGIGAAVGFGGSEPTRNLYSFSSFATPPSIYHYTWLPAPAV